MCYMGQNARPVSKATRALAEAIREAQGAKNMSTAELARRSKIPYSTLRKIRAGTQTIDYEELRQIADALRGSAAVIAARAEAIETES